ncbi:hypothetical protein Tco_0787528 [Tanacetum coccineum]
MILKFLKLLRGFFPNLILIITEASSDNNVWDSSKPVNHDSCLGTHVVGEDDFLAVAGKWNGVVAVVGLLNIYGPRDEYQRARLWNRLSSILTSVDTT